MTDDELTAFVFDIFERLNDVSLRLEALRGACEEHGISAEAYERHLAGARERWNGSVQRGEASQHQKWRESLLRLLERFEGPEQ